MRISPKYKRVKPIRLDGDDDDDDDGDDGDDGASFGRLRFWLAGMTKAVYRGVKAGMIDWFRTFCTASAICVPLVISSGRLVTHVVMNSDTASRKACDVFVSCCAASSDRGDKMDLT